MALGTRLLVGPWMHADVVRFPDGSTGDPYRRANLNPWQAGSREPSEFGVVLRGDWQGSARVSGGERRLSAKKAHARHRERQAQHGDRSRYSEHGNGILYTWHGTKLHKDPRLAGATPRTITQTGYRTITHATQTAKLLDSGLRPRPTSACSAQEASLSGGSA